MFVCLYQRNEELDTQWKEYYSSSLRIKTSKEQFRKSLEDIEAKEKIVQENIEKLNSFERELKVKENCEFLVCVCNYIFSSLAVYFDILLSTSCC